MAAKGTFTITAKNEASGALTQVKNELTGLENYAKSSSSTMSKLSSTFSKFGGTAAIVAGVTLAFKGVSSAVSNCWKNFQEADLKYKQLSTTLGNGEAYDSAVDTINRLARQTTSAKGDVESMVAELAAMGKSADEIDKISTAAVALSNVTGKDLNSTMTTLLNTYNGTATQLQKMGVDVSNLSKEQLKQGDAVQLVIDKYAALSEEMASQSGLQALSNIQDTLGDIGQSVGDLFNIIISPALTQIDTWTASFKTGFDGWVQDAKGVLTNLPTIFSALFTAIKADLSNFFRPTDFFSNLTTNLLAFGQNVATFISSEVTLIGNAVANLGTLAYELLSRSLEGIGNYAMAWITSIADEAGIDISAVINSIGQWLQESPIGQIVDQILTTAINGVKVVGTIIKNIPQILKIVLANAGDMISAFFNAIPDMVSSIFNGIINWFPYVALSLKNHVIQAVQDAINGILKLFGISGKSAVNFNIDRTSENAYKEKAEEGFQLAADAFQPVADVLEETGKEITDLLNPKIDEVVSTNLTLGDKMATWAAKSSDEYYQAAKKNFSSISEFLGDWFTTFSSDLSMDIDDVVTSFTSMADIPAFDNLDSFIDWFRDQDWSTQIKVTTTSSGTSLVPVPTSTGEGSDEGSDDGSGSGSGSDDNKKSVWSQVGEAAKNALTSTMGEAGTLINTAAQNISQMGIVAGLVATVIEYIIKLLDTSTLAAIEEAINPVLSMLKALASALSPIIQVLTEVFQPVLTGLATVFIWAMGNIRHVFASVVNWLASWIPWVNSVSDAGSVSWSDAYAQANAGGTVGSGSAYSSSSTQSAIAGASYSGQTTIHLTINQNSPVVGENGMREFASMIRSELLALDTYGY